MAEIYDVERETEFNREKLRRAIPKRLQELAQELSARKIVDEGWYVDLVIKLLQSVHRVGNDLLKTIDQEAVSAAAWNSRNYFAGQCVICLEEITSAMKRQDVTPRN